MNVSKSESEFTVLLTIYIANIYAYTFIVGMKIAVRLLQFFFTYILACGDDGHYEPMDCIVDTQTCYCVDPLTGEILKTQTNYHPFVNWDFADICKKSNAYRYILNWCKREEQQIVKCVSPFCCYYSFVVFRLIGNQRRI